MHASEHLIEFNDYFNYNYALARAGVTAVHYILIIKAANVVTYRHDGHRIIEQSKLIYYSRLVGQGINVL